MMLTKKMVPMVVLGRTGSTGVTVQTTGTQKYTTSTTVCRSSENNTWDTRNQ